MKNTLKQWLEKKGMERWFQRDNLIILILSGILLFIIALPTKENKQSAEQADLPEGRQSWDWEGEGDETSQDISRSFSAVNSTQEDYCTYLEQKLAEVISGMDGVGKVKVMVTLQSSEELVVEKDKPVTRQSTNEQDSQGGSRITNQADTSESTVYRTQGGNSEPYVVKTLLPKVEGVVVVAKGAGRGTVDKSITEIVQALFDLEAHKIKVVKMEGEN